MKKIISMFIAVMIMACSLTACGSGTDSGSSKKDKIQIVTTIFPEYDWVRNVLGDNPAEAEVTMLLDNGVDLHSFQPTASDILKLSTCDLFIYVGGESDDWVEDALKEATNKDMIVINLLEVLGDKAKEEEIVPGMEEEEEEAPALDTRRSEAPAMDTRRSEAPALDEHVWLSLRNAAYLVGKLSDAMQSMDGAHAEVYKANAENYVKKLEDLDAKYEKAVSETSVKTLLFGDRFPFRYLTDDYGLSYYAAFAGCSAETEASFETIAFLAQKTDELSLHAVMTIEGTNHKIAETIVQSTKSKDQQILTMDSMQSTTMKDMQNGTTYLSIMEKNLDVLTKALN